MKDVARSFPPIVDERAHVLILGSMPGAASLEAGQYYAHPRNAFWPIMGELFGAGPELPYGERCDRLRAAGIGVWDVLKQCRRVGSLDASIERETEVANDFQSLFARCPSIVRVVFNGRKAESAYLQHVAPLLDEKQLSRLELVLAPSTSPAYAGKSLDEKLAMWRTLLVNVRL